MSGLQKETRWPQKSRVSDSVYWLHWYQRLDRKLHKPVIQYSEDIFCVEDRTEVFSCNKPWDAVKQTLLHTPHTRNCNIKVTNLDNVTASSLVSKGALAGLARNDTVAPCCTCTHEKQPYGGRMCFCCRKQRGFKRGNLQVERLPNKGSYWSILRSSCLAAAFAELHPLTTAKQLVLWTDIHSAAHNLCYFNCQPPLLSKADMPNSGSDVWPYPTENLRRPDRVLREFSHMPLSLLAFWAMVRKAAEGMLASRGADQVESYTQAPPAGLLEQVTSLNLYLAHWGKNAVKAIWGALFFPFKRNWLLFPSKLTLWWLSQTFVFRL